MRLNESLLLQGPLARLVPYRPEHVPQYHAWMQDPALLELTCSEPLSLEEERANQISWCEDELKLTFIVCAAPPGEPLGDLRRGMAGDVNAFFMAWDTASDEPAAPGADSDSQPLLAEVEIMVADSAQRRRGLGREASLLFLQYVASHVPRVCAFCAKIGEDNEPSLRLFEQLGFHEHKRLTAFKQVELRMPLTAEVHARLRDECTALGATELELQLALGGSSQ